MVDARFTAVNAYDELTRPSPSPGTPVFEWTSQLYLAPSLAEVLATEGAYDRGPSRSDALDMSSAFVADLTGERWDAIHVLHSTDAWCGYFTSNFADHTWIVTNFDTAHATLLCTTDDD